MKLITLIIFLLATQFFTQTAEANFIWPVPQRNITAGFSAWHEGIDIDSPCGTPVKAVKSGTVTQALYGWSDGYGNTAVIDDGIDWVRYAHLSTISVSLGQYVAQGDVIGLSGNTGNVRGVYMNGVIVGDGCHLHLEIGWYGWGGAKVDPMLPLP